MATPTKAHIVENLFGQNLFTIDGKTLNEELLKSGMAWFFTKYCKESFCERWKRYEEAASKSKVGLWSMPNPVPPWDFRHPKQGVSP